MDTAPGQGGTTDRETRATYPGDGAGLAGDHPAEHEQDSRGAWTGPYASPAIATPRVVPTTGLISPISETAPAGMARSPVNQHQYASPVPATISQQVPADRRCFEVRGWPLDQERDGEQGEAADDQLPGHQREQVDRRGPSLDQHEAEGRDHHRAERADQAEGVEVAG